MCRVNLNLSQTGYLIYALARSECFWSTHHSIAMLSLHASLTEAKKEDPVYFPICVLLIFPLPCGVWPLLSVAYLMVFLCSYLPSPSFFITLSIFKPLPHFGLCAPPSLLHPLLSSFSPSLSLLLCSERGAGGRSSNWAFSGTGANSEQKTQKPKKGVRYSSH